ncbi:hypothetical protein M422DRAFT_72783 [Sphaerobolus stellatus SS14]|nr:hypothetical protein M422DRAFT_72783 [Sphaerobolus stellatus SS14]
MGQESEDLFRVPELLHFQKDNGSEGNSVIPSQLPTTSYQTVDMSFSCRQPNTPTCTIKLTVDAGPGCGGIAWPAGCVLANYLTTRKTLQGLKILELGSGTGLVGIVAGLLHADSVWVTDQEPLLDLIRSNIDLNGLQNVHVAKLDWGTALDQGIRDDIDLILAADCVYFEPAFPLLVETLCALAARSRNPEILFCYKKRRKADKRFFALLKKEFTWKEVLDDPRHGEYNQEGIFLYHLMKK